MNKFLEKSNLLKLSEEVAEGLNRPITADKPQAVIKKLPAHKSPGPESFTKELLQNISGRANLYPSQTIPENPRRGKTPDLFL